MTKGCKIFTLVSFFFAVLVPIGFMVSGRNHFYSVYYRHLVGTYAARHWVQVPCVVVSSEANPSDPLFFPKIRFEYEFNGRKYQSDRFHVAPILDSNISKHTLAKYPSGRQTVCYVNPDDPSQAALNNRFAPASYGAIIPLGVFGFGLYRFLFFVSKIIRGRPPLDSSCSSGVSIPPGMENMDLEASREFSYARLAKSKRGTSAILTVGLYFNCCVLSILFPFVKFLFVNHVLWLMGILIVLLLFNALFLLIMAVVFGGLYMDFLHPEIIVRVTPVPLRPGETATFSWQVRRRIRYLSRLTITLSGQSPGKAWNVESVTEWTVLDTQSPLEMENGYSQINIPDDRPVSELSWEIHLVGRLTYKWFSCLDKVFPIEMAKVSESVNCQYPVLNDIK
jgi:hypothetical protein